MAAAAPAVSNAIYNAYTPTLDRLFAHYPHTLLKAHGKFVGMPSNEDMGNSEVGHNAIGAGRVFDQGAKLVNREIASGGIYETPLWKEIIGRCLQGGTLHFIGLLSDGNVHSHIDHLFSMVRKAAQTGVARLRVHPLMDGHRDAFARFDGAARRCTYDSQKPVVLRWEGQQPILNLRFVDFATYEALAVMRRRSRCS